MHAAAEPVKVVSLFVSSSIFSSRLARPVVLPAAPKTETCTNLAGLSSAAVAAAA